MKPVKKRNKSNKLTSENSRQIPKLNMEAAIPQTKKTFDGAKISDMANIANTKVPAIKPN
ncbi:hypothetical protein GCM10022246_20600 [Pedobacter ginsengiterrae]|uniref:Uncharacterized protein n=1 Tax=Pedobacter ginsengiterrae TaxID=871696 RepID=A0ABP7PLJ4_9SPHI